MAKSKLITVRDDVIEGYCAKIGSASWQEFLNEVPSFRYEPKQLEGYDTLRYGFTCTARSRKDSDSKYWYGVRKVNGKLRQEYISESEDLDYEKLQIAVDNLSLSDIEYYRLKKPKAKVDNPPLEEELLKLKSELESVNSEILAIAEKIEIQEKSFKPNSATEALKRILDLAEKIKSQK